MGGSVTRPPVSAALHPGTATGYLAVGRLALALIVIQFGLAGLAAFQGLSGGDIEDTWWAPHQVLGYVISLLVVVLLVLALVARLGPAVARATVVAALLAVLQPVLAELGDELSAWLGALHALGGVGVAAALGIVTARVGRARAATA